jgi:HD-like signal output (HDOD) protein
MSAAICPEIEQKTTPEAPGGAPWRVLFIGSDPLWFGQIQGDFGCLQPDWICLHATSVSELEDLKWRTANAFVMEAKALCAREWLEKAKKELPDLNCLVRCDLSDKLIADRWKGLGYPMLPSYSDASAVASSLVRNARLQEWKADPAIQRLLPSLRKLPAMPKLFLQVTEELRSSNGSLDVVAHLIRQDPVMSAKMLQLVNSAFFASAREVTDTLDATMMLGTERIKSLILLAGIFSQYKDAQGICPSSEALQTHSIRVGTFARAITLSETKNAEMAESAFTAGILHDMGKMIIAGNLPVWYKEVPKLRAAKQLTDYAAELEIFGANHANVGAYLLASWGLPLAILEAVAWHHEPERSSERDFCLLAAVHAANAFAHEEEGTPVELCKGFFERIGLPDGIQRWRQVIESSEAKTK